MINLTTQQDFYNGSYEDGVADGIQRGIEKGRALGAEQERKAYTKALLAAGVPAETIASALGMTVEEVKGLA